MEQNNINIGPSTIDFLLSRRNSVVEAIDKLNSELVNIDAALKILKGDVQESSNQLKKGETTFNWKENILSLLKKENRIMKTRDIVVSLFPNDSEAEIKKKILLAAGALNYAVKKTDSDIKSYITENPKNYFFGLKEWFDSEQKLKDEYKIKNG